MMNEPSINEIRRDLDQLKKEVADVKEDIRNMKRRSDRRPPSPQIDDNWKTPRGKLTPEYFLEL